MSRSIWALLLTVFLLLVTTAPAVAKADVSFSPDGVSFADALPESLFSSDLRWVPGDARSRTFFVRNESEQRAVMVVDFVATDPGGLLATRDLTVSASADGGPVGTTSSAGMHRLVSDVVVPASGVARIDVDVAFDPASDNPSQLSSMRFDFVVRLTEDEVLAENEAGGLTAPGGGILPGTGAEASLAMLAAASCLTLTGFVLVSRTRRSRGAAR